MLIWLLFLLYAGDSFPAPLPSPLEDSRQASFRFHLKHEPSSLDPGHALAGESDYLFENLYRGLIRYTDEGQLIFDLASKCTYQPDQIVLCHLKKSARWSDGTPILAQDFVTSFQYLLSPQTGFSESSLLLNIKNARLILAGKKSPQELGMTAISPDEIRFSLEKSDQEFLEKLSNPRLCVFKKDLFSGPYRLKTWLKTKKLMLTSNEFYEPSSAGRPPVEIYFAAEDTTALNLYEKGVLNFLWRLPTTYIPRYKDRPDFFQKTVDRFDYIGFSQKTGSPFQDKNNRQAFAESLNFESFKKLFFALGSPGCPGLDEGLIDPDPGHCLSFNTQALPLSIKNVKFWFSQLGGDDIKKSAEWFQEEWRKNLGIKVEIKSLEQKHFLTLLKTDPPDIFRKGVGLNRPTCLAALEIFRKESPENFTRFENRRFENITTALEEKKMTSSEKKSICAAATDLLFKEEYVGIPLGRIHFTMLAQKEFQGWTLNDLNELDLTHLHHVGAPDSVPERK